MTIFSWTAPGANYPEFFNVSDGADERGRATIKVTVRGPRKADGLPGDTVSVTLPHDEYSILVGHLQHHFNEILRLGLMLGNDEQSIAEAMKPPPAIATCGYEPCMHTKQCHAERERKPCPLPPGPANPPKPPHHQPRG